MKWNFDMDSCPLDTKVRLLSGDGDLLLPRQEFIGTIVDNGRYRTRGECFKGDPEYFYRSAIVAWKPLEYELEEKTQDMKRLTDAIIGVCEEYIDDDTRHYLIEQLIKRYVMKFTFSN